MIWECAECGGQIERHRRPTVCPICGLGGPVFVPMGTLTDGDELTGGLRDAWLEVGMRWAGRSPPPVDRWMTELAA